MRSTDEWNAMDIHQQIEAMWSDYRAQQIMRREYAQQAERMHEYLAWTNAQLDAYQQQIEAGDFNTAQTILRNLQQRLPVESVVAGTCLDCAGVEHDRREYIVDGHTVCIDHLAPAEQ